MMRENFKWINNNRLHQYKINNKFIAYSNAYSYRININEI